MTLTLAEIHRLEDVRRSAALFRAQPPGAGAPDFVGFVRSLVVDETPPR